MKLHRLTLESVIAVTAGLSGVYLVSVLLELPIIWMLSLYSLSIVALVWMVIRILKDPYTTDKTFDEYFYQDREDLRRIEEDSVDR